MKKLYTLVASLALAAAASAQTWQLSQMTDETFAVGGDAQWSFQKYDLETGVFSTFEYFDEQSACNYVDIYQPERAGGQLFQDIDKEMIISGEYTRALTDRNAWHDTDWTAPSRTDANAKFVYVSRAEMLDNAFEVCGNQQYNAVISFTVPADGCYSVNGTVIRQDGANLKAISVVPRMRLKGTTTLDAAISRVASFPFGEGGEFIDGVTNYRLADGYEQRFTPQQPASFTFAFKAKADDIVSFEVSYADLTPSNWPRDYYPRTFYRQLDIQKVDEATAAAAEVFINPYDQSTINLLTDKLSDYEDLLTELPVGSNPGEYPYSDVTEFDELCADFYDLIQDGTINATNVNEYIRMLEEAWEKLMASKVIMDFDVEGNYRLFASAGRPADGDLELKNDPAAMAANEDTPWGFYGRVVNTGVFERFANHDAGNLAKEDAWYRGANQWYYITDNGSLHPLTDRAPGIMFTALQDGVYRLDLSVYRPNPNPSVENPLYIRWYHLFEGAETAPTDQAVLSRQYGSVANDGEGGKAPIDMVLYANMKEGDRLFFEVDCYTSGRNSSAGTQILNLSAGCMISYDEPITAEYAAASGQLFLNPYGTGDCTALREAIAEATELIASTVVGTEPGQYPEEAQQALAAVLAEANEYAALEGGPSLTQSVVDQMTNTLLQAIQAYKDARIPYTFQPTGDYGIRFAANDKFITRKNQGNGDFYYADLINLDGVYAEMNRVGIELEDFTWTYSITPVEGTTAVTITTADGYMTPDAYIALTPEDDSEFVLPTFTFVRETPDADVFAIRRNSDGLYWDEGIAWKSPYNKINTSDVPKFIWTLDATTIDQAVGISAPASVSRQLSTVSYYDLSGRRVSATTRGLLIRRVTYADSTVQATKIVK